jgi:hypothetical protein
MITPKSLAVVDGLISLLFIIIWPWLYTFLFQVLYKFGVFRSEAGPSSLAPGFDPGYVFGLDFGQILFMARCGLREPSLNSEFKVYP